MKKTVSFVFTAIFGTVLGLLLNDQAHRYTSWLYQVHYGEMMDMGSISVPRFFAAPIYATGGFFAALYALVSAGEKLKKAFLLFGAYLFGSALGFAVSLGVYPLFHRLAAGNPGDRVLTAYIGLDVFVCPLLVFGTAFLAVRLAHRLRA